MKFKQMFGECQNEFESFVDSLSETSANPTVVDLYYSETFDKTNTSKHERQMELSVSVNYFECPNGCEHQTDIESQMMVREINGVPTVSFNNPVRQDAFNQLLDKNDYDFYKTAVEYFKLCLTSVLDEAESFDCDCEACEHDRYLAHFEY